MSEHAIARWMYIALAVISFALHFVMLTPITALLGLGDVPPGVRADTMASACFFMICAVYLRVSERAR